MVTIVGVNPRGFTGAKNVQGSPDLFVPISMQPVIDPKGKTSLLTDSTLWWVNIVGRIKPGVKESEAQAALDVQLQSAVRATMPLTAGRHDAAPSACRWQPWFGLFRSHVQEAALCPVRLYRVCCIAGMREHCQFASCARRTAAA